MPFNPFAQTGPMPGQANMNTMATQMSQAPQVPQLPQGPGLPSIMPAPMNTMGIPPQMTQALQERLAQRAGMWGAGQPMPTSRAPGNAMIPPEIHNMLMERFAQRPGSRPTGPYDPNMGGGVQQPQEILSGIGQNFNTGGQTTNAGGKGGTGGSDGGQPQTGGDIPADSGTSWPHPYSRGP